MRTRQLSLGPDRQKLAAKFNRASPAPGPVTRIADRLVAFLAALESKWSKPEPVEESHDEVKPVSARNTVIWFAVMTVLYPYLFRIDRAPLFFGAMVSASLAFRAWKIWNRANPPIPDADSKAAGVIPAVVQASIALVLVLLLGFAVKSCLPHPNEYSDFNQLISASATAAYVYQRRTGWKHSDPEIGMVIAGIVAVVVALWTIVSLVIGRFSPS